MSLKNSLDQTNLDIENPFPNGGPNNFPQYNHSQKYSPTNTHLDIVTYGGNGSGTNSPEASEKSDFGIVGDQVNSTKNIFKDGTSLDVENSLPDGGPNRNNAGAYNIPTGQYTNIGTEGTLFDEDGNAVITQVHQYLPNKRYTNSFPPGSLPANS